MRGVMAVQTHPTAVPVESPPRPRLRVVEARRQPPKPHLFTYIVGNALCWTLWAALSVSAEHWYWWVVVPLVGWTLVLTLELRHAYRH